MAYPNQVRLNSDDLIEVVYRGDQTYETVTAANKTGKMLADRLRRRGAPVLVLVNLGQVGKNDVNARRATAEALKKFEYDRIAVFGASAIIEKTAGLIVRAVRKEKKIRIFPSRQLAVAWLFGLPDSVSPTVEVKEEASVYRTHVKRKIDELNDIISLATIGEYTSNITIPDEMDEFTDTFVGLRLLIETLEEKAQRIKKLTPQVRESPSESNKQIFFERKAPSPHRW